MENTTVFVTDAPEKEILQKISDGLHAFNDEVSGVSDRVPLAVVAKDEKTGEIIGGITGRTALGVLFLDMFHLPKSHRGSGLGSRILKMAEDEGRRRGCVSAVLYTINFQAPEFYARYGWQRFGEIPSLPAGTSRIFMSKAL